MATFSKFNAFVEALAEKKHDLSADTLKIAFTNTEPAATDAVFDPVTAHPPPAAVDGYTTGGHATAQVTSEQTVGTYKLVLTDVELNAGPGGIGPFRYILLYNDTTPDDALVGWWDYGSSITLNDGESIKLDVSDALGVFTIA